MQRTQQVDADEAGEADDVPPDGPAPDAVPDAPETRVIAYLHERGRLTRRKSSQKRHKLADNKTTRYAPTGAPTT